MTSSVLAVSYTAIQGGSERVLADHLTAFGDEVWLACPEGDLARVARGMGVRVFPLRERSIEARTSVRRRLTSPLALAGFTRELRGLVRSLRPDVVVAWGTRPALACAALRPEPPFVVQVNELMPGGSFDRPVRAAVRRAARVVAPSRAAAHDLDPDGRLGDRLSVVHPGVDLERFTPEPLPPAPPGALFLGAIVPVKRPDLAIEVAEIAGIPLVIAGAPLDPASERLAAGLRERAGPLVEFAGAVDDPRPLLRDASALLHCADREAYGMALVEALACGRPVVAPDAGGPAEIVDQSCGRLYPPGDAHAAAAALAEAVADPELGAGARRRAESEFGLDRSRREWSAVVGGLARRAGGRAGEGLALVTVLHDSEPDVRRLVASVERHLPRAHLVAVDSGSSDGGAALVRGSSLRTTVIELDNVGYGRGSNRGLEAVEEPVTVILNPDVELLDDSLAALAAEVARDGGPERILAPVVVLPGGTRQDSVHPLPLSAPEAVTALVPPAALPPPLRLHAQPWRADHPRRAGWAVGCCIAGRTGTLRRLGPFDESVFMYGEDMELGMRAARDGVETWFWPAARVLHHQAQSSGRAFGGEPYEMLARRRREVIRDERGALAQRADDALQLVSIGGRLAAKTLLRRPAERERERLRALGRARRETELG